MAARMRDKYTGEILPALMKEFGYTSTMQAPRILKVVVNVGLGEAIQNPKLMDGVVKELTEMTGQKPVVKKARKSIAAFKLREGMAVGAMVTLRQDKMWEFLDRLVNVALPRIRDFKGVSPKAFDGRGNYSLGLKEQYIFPEIDYDKVEMVHGLDIAIVTSAKTDEEGKSLLRQIGMPFRK
ncbi:MAG: 50S ribosomal protein L5 [Nitrospirae bacterium]|nr:50S ribosomal protein L5 [Nitrospirota bacterium]